jgi:hypothetical protein
MDRRTRTLTTRYTAALTTLDLIRKDHLQRAITIATLDHEASYHTTPGDGGRSNTHSDPTAARAGRHHPPNPTQLINQLADTANALYDLALTGDTNPRSRPELGAPCRGGQTHHENDHGNCVLESCGKRWPCNPAQPDYWWDPCQGVLKPDADRCPRCELHRDSWICRDCPTGQDVHHRSEHSRNGLCDRCRKRNERRKDDAT